MMTTEAKYIFWVDVLNGKSCDHELGKLIDIQSRN